jgi:hypothetical protein
MSEFNDVNKPPLLGKTNINLTKMKTPTYLVLNSLEAARFTSLQQLLDKLRRYLASHVQGGLPEQNHKHSRSKIAMYSWYKSIM